MNHYEINWRPEIGDPTIIGWLTVIGYFVCALFCLRTWLSSGLVFQHYRKRQAYLWIALSLLMVALGLNKQLDLQTLFTEVARYLSHEQGWYEQRRYYQRLFIYAVMGLSLVLVMLLTLLYRPVLTDYLFAIAGVTLLFAFIVIRAASFHDFDLFINVRVVGLRMNSILELSGIGLVWWNARLIHYKPFLQAG